MAVLSHNLLTAITRRYPFYSGCGTLADHRFMHWLLPGTPAKVWAQTPGGKVRVPLDDYVGRAVFLFGDLDPKITWVLRKIIRPGAVVADIGANFGVVSALMSKLVGPNGRVLAFEPNPELSDILSESFESRPNIQLFKVGLGPSRKQMTLHVPSGNYGAASVVEERTSMHSHSVEIHTLDELLAGENSPKVSFLKIDVEGFEADVLQGARNTLRNDRPIILFECNDGKPAAFDLLHELNYGFVTLPKRLLRMSAQKFTYRPGQLPLSHDAVAIPIERFDSAACQLRAKGEAKTL